MWVILSRCTEVLMYCYFVKWVWLWGLCLRHFILKLLVLERSIYYFIVTLKWFPVQYASECGWGHLSSFKGQAHIMAVLTIAGSVTALPIMFLLLCGKNSLCSLCRNPCKYKKCILHHLFMALITPYLADVAKELDGEFKSCVPACWSRVKWHE